MTNLGKTIRLHFGICVISLIFAVQVAAKDSTDSNESKSKAVRAYNSGDFKQAFDLLQPIAVQGDLEAKYYLGVLYSRG